MRNAYCSCGTANILAFVYEKILTLTFLPHSLSAVGNEQCDQFLVREESTGSVCGL